MGHAEEIYIRLHSRIGIPVFFPPSSVMDHKHEKDVESTSISSGSAPHYEFYDPSKESRLTRLGLTFESFKRAPGVTRYVLLFYCKVGY